MDGKYTLEGSEWKNRSEKAKDFISKLLVVDPVSRMSAKQAMEHSWFDMIRRKVFLFLYSFVQNSNSDLWFWRYCL